MLTLEFSDISLSARWGLLADLLHLPCFSPPASTPRRGLSTSRPPCHPREWRSCRTLTSTLHPELAQLPRQHPHPSLLHKGLLLPVLAVSAELAQAQGPTDLTRSAGLCRLSPHKGSAESDSRFLRSRKFASLRSNASGMLSQIKPFSNWV